MSSQKLFTRDKRDDYAPRTGLLERWTLLKKAFSSTVRLGRTAPEDPLFIERLYTARLYNNRIWPGRYLQHFESKASTATPASRIPPLEVLIHCKPGTLGHAYACYMGAFDDSKYLGTVHQKIVFVEQSDSPSLPYPEDPRLEFRDEVFTLQHDLYHVLSGYDTSPLGELCLQALLWVQVRSGMGFILVFGGIRRAIKHRAWADLTAILHGLGRGMRAQVLLTTDWQPLWELPLSQVKDRLRL